MASVSTKPYLVRAIYDWCVDQGYTPYLAVAVNTATRVPIEYVKDGKIVLNISPSASQGLLMDNVWVRFSARFNGVARQIEVPMDAVEGIFSRENGEGMAFQAALGETGAMSSATPPDDPEPTPPKRPRFQVVK